MTITKSQLARKLITGTTSGTPGTRTNHAHGLPWTPDPNDIVIVGRSVGDNDNNDCGAIVIVKTSSTTVTVKSNVASLPFALHVECNQETGERDVGD